MALKDALEKVKSKKPGPRCALCTIQSQLNDADADTLAAALADGSVRSSDIARALMTEGYEIRPYGVNRHRAGECAGR